MRKVLILAYEKNDLGNNNYETKQKVVCKGLFHQWGVNYEEFETGPGNYTVAIVELLDGKVKEVTPDLIQFVESF